MTAPSEIPKPLYDLIQNAARVRKSLKRNGNNSDPKTFFMAHVPKPPTPPKPKPKTKKKKIKITWSSDNYHGSYLLNDNELEVWNSFRMTDKA
ncbi:hypothetical protein Tco_1331883, partial [Tanacetum coccineum]